MSDHELERDLERLATTVQWPPTPDLAVAVRTRIEARANTDPAHPARRRALARVARVLPPLATPRQPVAVVTSTLACLLLAVAVVPPARSAVLRLLGITHGERIVRVPAPPKISQERLDLGRRVSLAEAARRVSFRIRIPERLGAPPEVRYTASIAGGAVSLVYPRGTVITEFEGSATPYVEKRVDPSTRVRQVDVAGARGFFLTGGAITVLVLDRHGRVVEGPAPVHANVLVWDRGNVAFRMETRAGPRRAVALAASVR